jgi:hypothetical protein
MLQGTGMRQSISRKSIGTAAAAAAAGTGVGCCDGQAMHAATGGTPAASIAVSRRSRSADKQTDELLTSCVPHSTLMARCLEQGLQLSTAYSCSTVIRICCVVHLLSKY